MSEQSRSIRIVHSESATGWGGQQIRIVTECLKQIEAGNHVALLCTPGSAIESRAAEAGIPVKSIAMGRITIPGILRVCKFLREFRPDILNTHSSGDSWTALLAARLVGGIRTVRTRHIAREFNRNLINTLLYVTLPDYTTTTGETARRQMIEMIGVSPDRIESIPTGIDFERFDPDQVDGRKFREEIGVPEGVPLIGTVGILYKVKGHEYFLEAAVRVATKRPDARFVIVGDVPAGDCEDYKRNLFELIDRLGLREKVVMTGFRSDVPEILAALDIFVLASLNEGIPQALVQAMGMRLPSVATSVGGVPELISTGETGILIPKEDSESISDAIMELLADMESARRMGLNAREKVENGYSLPSMMEKTRRVYDMLLKS